MTSSVRAVRGWLAAAAFAAGALGLGATAHAQPKNGAPTEDFGTPPSGTISILFNDHHVYSRPDHLKAGPPLCRIESSVEKQTVVFLK